MVSSGPGPSSDTAFASGGKTKVNPGDTPLRFTEGFFDGLLAIGFGDEGKRSPTKTSPLSVSEEGSAVAIAVRATGETTSAFWVLIYLLVSIGPQQNIVENSASIKVKRPAGTPSVGEKTIDTFLTVILLMSLFCTTRSK